MRLAVRKWLAGLAGGFVGGLAGAIDSSLALMVLVPEKFNLNAGLKTTLTTALVLGILTGVKCACAYLKQSPIPPDDDVAIISGKVPLIIGLFTFGLWLCGCSVVSNNRVFPKLTWYWTQEAKQQRQSNREHEMKYNQRTNSESR